MEIYRTRNRAILKVLIPQYGVNEAYDMHGWALRNPEKCIVCQSEINSYSEWHETGYEHRRCSSGCWDHTTTGLWHDLQTKGFTYSGKFVGENMKGFENQIKKNAADSKRRRQLFHKKKKSQRKRL